MPNSKMLAAYVLHQLADSENMGSTSEGYSSKAPESAMRLLRMLPAESRRIKLPVLPAMPQPSSAQTSMSPSWHKVSWQQTVRDGALAGMGGNDCCAASAAGCSTVPGL